VIVNLFETSTRLKGYVLATQDVMETKLLPVNQSELVVEQRPSLYGSQVSNELEPLRLSVTWCRDDRFKLQVSGRVIDFMFFH